MRGPIDSQPSGSSTGQPCCVVDGARVVVPDAFPLLGSSYHRSGADLQMVAPGGAALRIDGFFAGSHLPDIAHSGHDFVSGRYIAGLADTAALPMGGSVDAGRPSAAHLGAISGFVTVVRAGGAIEAAAPGEALGDGDALQAAGGHALVILPGGRTLAVIDRGHVIFHQAIAADATGERVRIEAAGGSFLLAAAGASPVGMLVIDTPAGLIHTGPSGVVFRHGSLDGLKVTLLGEPAADDAGVAVENDFGRVSTDDAGRSITVGGPDQAPEITVDAADGSEAAAITAAGGEVERAPDDLEVSPGGDLDAYAGDPIVVTGAAALFDLTPEAASLQTPALTGGVSPSGAFGPRPFSEELLLTAHSATVTAGSPRPFQLTGWEPLGLVWDVMRGVPGGAEVSEIGVEAGHSPSRAIAPTDARSMAHLRAPADGLGPLDEFLGLSPTELAAEFPGSRLVSANAIRSSAVNLTAGSTLSFDFFFDAGNEFAGAQPKRDLAVFTIDGRVFKLADSVATEVDGATGWRTFVFSVTHSGTYHLGFAAVNDETTDPSQLFVDNVRINRTFDSSFVQKDGSAAEGWHTLAQGPTLLDHQLSTTEDAAVSTTSLTLLAGAHDPDPFDALRFIGIDHAGTEGRADFFDDGTVTHVTYDPDGRLDGLAEGETTTTSFRYEVDAGNGVIGSGQVTVTVTGVNDAPTANAGVTEATEDGAVDIAVLRNDDDVDSDDDRGSLRVVAAQSASGVAVEFSGLAGAGVVYRPDGRFTSLAEKETATDTITYTIEDRHRARATATETITIHGVNDAPVAVADQASGDEDHATRFTPIANDTDPDLSDRLRITAIFVGGVARPIAAGGQVTLSSGAVVTLGTDGALTYDPRGLFDSLAAGGTAVEVFRYQIGDGHGGVADAEARVTITGRNDAPVASADFGATVGTNALTIAAASILANDRDPDQGDTLRLIGVDGTGTRGSVALQNGQIRYDPGSRFAYLGEGETAQDVFHYVAADGAIGSGSDRLAAIGSVTVTVTGVNDPVDAVDDTFVTGEDDPIEAGTPGVLANDIDPDLHDTRTIVAVSGQAANVGIAVELASGAFATISASGRMTYEQGSVWNYLAVSEQGQDSITYTVSDGHGSADTAQVTISITGTNDIPVAIADIAPTDEDSSQRVAVFANDSDPDLSDTHVVHTIILQAPDGTQTLGTVRINADNTLTYNPEGQFDWLRPGEIATDTFQYVIDDGHGGRATNSVTITLHGVDNPQPAAHQELLDSFEVALSSDFSEHGLTPLFQLEGSGSLAPEFVSIDEHGHELPPISGTHLGNMAVLTADGSSRIAIERFLSSDIEDRGRPLVSLPSDASDGSLANSGAGVRTTLSLGTDDVVDGRILVSFDWNFVVDQAETNNNDFAVFTVTDGVTTKVFKLSDARTVDWTSSDWRTSIYDLTHDFAIPSGGTLDLTVGFAVLNDETPNDPAHLLLDNVRLNRPLGGDYELMSTLGGLQTYRQAPTALPDATATNEDAPATITAAALLANDFASRGIDRGTLVLSGVDTAGTHGAVSVDAQGIRYDPRGAMNFLAEGQVGTDTFRYTVTDGNGGTSDAQVTVTVTGRNDAPEAAADFASATEKGAPVAIDVLANDDDIDSDDDSSTLRIVSAVSTAGAAVTFAGALGAGLIYDARTVAAFAGLGEGDSLVDTVGYTVEDRHGALATGTVAVTVYGVNDAPIARNDTAGTNEDTAISIAVLANDSDPDLHDRLSVAGVYGTAGMFGTQVTLASGAVVVVAADGQLHYDPGAAFTSLARGQSGADHFSYAIADGHGGTSQAFVDVVVAGRNDAPVAGADTLATSAATRLTVAATTLLANDFDPDLGDSVHVLGIDATGTLGTVSFDGSTVTYDPGQKFRGLGEGETATDSFTYRLADHDGAVATGQVTVTVAGVQDPPTAVDDTAITDEDTAVTIAVVGNDSDPDTHDTLHVQSVDTTGTRGEVTINADGSITYDPRGHFDTLDAGQTDHDSFSYRVSDGHGGTDDATVTVSISGRPDTERLVDSFEVPISAANRTGSVATAAQYQETDGAHGLYRPTDGSGLARLEANGSTAATVAQFLGQPASSLPKDLVDNSFPAHGSAFKLKLTVQAGDEISFDWMFDARDATTSPSDGKADNDFAVFSVVGGVVPELFKLSDVRSTGDHGATGWRSSSYTASATGELTIGFASVNDRIGGSPTSENSFLLVDNLRLNRDFSSGYQLVDDQGNGHFETFVHT